MANVLDEILERLERIESQLEKLAENNNGAADAEQDEIVSVRAAARLCGAPPSNLYRAQWRERHHFPAPHMIGRRLVFRCSEVIEWFEQRKVEH